MRTKERLAQVLHAAGLFKLEGAARAGRYDDYESTSPSPIHDLVNDLRATGHNDLAERAIDGEWDGTGEEAKKWARGES